VVRGDEAGALGDGDQGSEIVKQVDKEEDEDDFEQALVKCAAYVEFEGGAEQGMHAAGRGRPAH
jgi:hypothetical protein